MIEHFRIAWTFIKIYLRCNPRKYFHSTFKTRVNYKFYSSLYGDYNLENYPYGDFYGELQNDFILLLEEKSGRNLSDAVT